MNKTVEYRNVYIWFEWCLTCNTLQLFQIYKKIKQNSICLVVNFSLFKQHLNHFFFFGGGGGSLSCYTISEETAKNQLLIKKCNSVTNGGHYYAAIIERL